MVYCRYFQQKAAKEGKKKRKVDEEDSDAESVTDAEFDQFIGMM